MTAKAIAALVIVALFATPLFAQGKGKGDNRDDRRSGKVDRRGDGNSGQGDDLHKKDKDHLRAHGKHRDDQRDGCRCPCRKPGAEGPRKDFDKSAHRPRPRPPEGKRECPDRKAKKPHEDNGHGNDPGHHDPSNPGKGKGNHGRR
jgi:hypothetical protein